MRLWLNPSQTSLITSQHGVCRVLQCRVVKSVEQMKCLCPSVGFLAWAQNPTRQKDMEKTKEARKTHVKRRAKTFQFSSSICKLHLGSLSPDTHKHAQQSRGGLALPISLIPPIMTDLHHETWTSLKANQTFHMHFWNASPTQLPSYWILIRRVKSPWNSLKSLNLTTTHINLEAPSPSTPINQWLPIPFPRHWRQSWHWKWSESLPEVDVEPLLRTWKWEGVILLVVQKCYPIREFIETCLQYLNSMHI